VLASIANVAVQFVCTLLQLLTVSWFDVLAIFRVGGLKDRITSAKIRGILQRLLFQYFCPVLEMWHLYSTSFLSDVF